MYLSRLYIKNYRSIKELDRMSSPTISHPIINSS